MPESLRMIVWYSVSAVAAVLPPVLLFHSWVMYLSTDYFSFFMRNVYPSVLERDIAIAALHQLFMANALQLNAMLKTACIITISYSVYKLLAVLLLRDKKPRLNVVPYIRTLYLMYASPIWMFVISKLCVFINT